MAIDLSSAWRRLAQPEKPQHDVHADGALTDTERDILDFEARGWVSGGQKMAAIRETFGWSETRYYQVLRSLLDRRAALEHSPATVLRLRSHLETTRTGRVAPLR